MADWTDIPDGNLAEGQPGRSVDWLAMRDNVTALAEGAAGAPRIVQAAIDNDAIGQAELKTGSGSGSVSNSVNADSVEYDVLVLPASAYGFFPRIRRTAGDSFAYVGHITPIRNTDLSGMGLALSGGGILGHQNTSDSTAIIGYRLNDFAGGAQTIGISLSQVYIQASPPYDLGNGVVPLFVFASIKDGAVKRTWIAVDPPWANNGPTNIRATHRRDGKSYRAVRRMPPRPAEARLMPQWAAECAALAADPKAVDIIEITQAVKQADMPLIPHPFDGNNLTGERIVMVDPCSPILAQCAILREQGIDLAEMLHSGMLFLDPDAKGLDRAGPPGVDILGLSWREPRQ